MLRIFQYLFVFRSYKVEKWDRVMSDIPMPETGNSNLCEAVGQILEGDSMTY
jgi:hypothetical protein